MNKATRIIVSSLGVFFAISGLSHGFFKILKGNKPTDGHFIATTGYLFSIFKPDQVLSIMLSFVGTEPILFLFLFV
jgi:hypothetical protein